jgi:hypothetical protein
MFSLFPAQDYGSIPVCKGALDGKLRLFRPDLSLGRIATSAERGDIPKLSDRDQQALLQCMKQFAKFMTENDHVPRATSSFCLVPTAYPGWNEFFVWIFRVSSRVRPELLIGIRLLTAEE